jgi:hypothetical protein
MGYSYSSDDGPEMCFNAPKNWQLGWYDDRQTTVSGGWSGDLIGIADYGDTNDGDTVIAQIPGTTEDWYVSFNRKTGINSGTPEGGNQVLVHKRPSGLGYGESTLMAKLSIGNTYSGTDAPPLQITVNAINLSANPAFASVTIGSVVTPVPTPVVTPAPTPVPVPPTPSHTHVWGVNSSDRIYYRAGFSGSWTRIGGALKQVSVSSDGNHVWGVNSNDQIYYRAGFSGSWTRIGGALKQVSV